MSISQLDPSLITLTPIDQNIVGSSPRTLTSAPDVSCLILASDVSGRWEPDDLQSPHASGPGGSLTETTRLAPLSQKLFGI
ncbi:hypothetical protein PGT21_024499 [Puccinia graminis f. sp. tritici]|uniref:Uncharacterized protein n=1 Tax=Puccinia graminis f. sp. tritici TaxID=56615 RepID=A0A5B0MAV5_PUCGR|nr:hypothetical protein PGT21_024499 [Puccinia graminis f. sp. tritici]